MPFRQVCSLLRSYSTLISRPVRPYKLHDLASYQPLLKRTMATAMAKRLEGKTIIVTGASSGIGRSTAFEFARTAPKNLKLILTARRLDTLKQIAEDIKKEVGDGVKVLPVQLDVSKSREVKEFYSNLPEEFKDVDVLVNNAGLVKGVAKAPEIEEEDMNIMVQTNFNGLVNMTQAIMPIFKKRGEAGQGDIINIGSIAGREAYPGGSIYCATKAAVRMFTDAMRRELIATRIRVIEIDPGQVETEFSVVRFYGDKAKADAVYAGCEPLTPDDIAEVVVFTAGRRENVVIADTLIYPNHQVSRVLTRRRRVVADVCTRRAQLSCTRRHRSQSDTSSGLTDGGIQETFGQVVAVHQMINVIAWLCFNTQFWFMHVSRVDGKSRCSPFHRLPESLPSNTCMSYSRFLARYKGLISYPDNPVDFLIRRPRRDAACVSAECLEKHDATANSQHVSSSEYLNLRQTLPDFRDQLKIVYSNLRFRSET